MFYKLITHIFLLMIVNGAQSECFTDQDCANGTYCYDSGSCVDCTNCNGYQRYAHPGFSCAKSKDQCGQCLPGKEAEYNIDGTLSVCRTITTRDFESDSNSITRYKLPIIVSSVIIVIAFISIIMCFVFKRCIQCNCTVCKIMHVVGRICPNWVINDDGKSTPPPSPSSTLRSQPPPYSTMVVHAPSAPPETTPIQCKVHRPVEFDNNQRATPFSHPDWVRQGGSTSQGPTDVYTDVNDGDEMEVNENDALIHEEDTLPSNWTPHANNSYSNEIHPLTTFENALHMPQVNFTQPGNSLNNNNNNNNNDIRRDDDDDNNNNNCSANNRDSSTNSNSNSNINSGSSNNNSNRSSATDNNQTSRFIIANSTCININYVPHNN